MNAKNIKLMIVSIMVQCIFCMTAADTNADTSTPSLDPINFADFGIEEINEPVLDENFVGPEYNLVAAGSVLAYAYKPGFGRKGGRNEMTWLHDALFRCYSTEKSTFASSCKTAMANFDDMVKNAKESEYAQHYPEIVTYLDDVNKHLFQHNHHNFTEADIEQEKAGDKGLGSETTRIEV
jgi:hypothetical protein